MKVNVRMLVAQSCLTRCDPMDCSPQDPLSMEFSKQEYWSELPFPPPGDLLRPGIKPMFPVLASGFSTTELSEKSPIQYFTRCLKDP